MSKITRPILTGVFSRKRLFYLLDNKRRRPAIWVSGPPGCGKTTFVASYLDARKLPCLWYQIDQEDNDPATFFYYLGHAAKKAIPRKRKPLPLLTPEYLQGISTFTLRYFEDLSNRLKIPSVLVFDNYQEVPIHSPFHEIILNGLSRIPEGINVILISRHDPPSNFIQLRANQLMEMIGWDELRCTPEESSEFIRLRTQGKLSRETIQHLHNVSNGWTAGLVLMLESIRRGIEPKLLGKLTPEEITDYFGNVLFNKTDKEIQEFFLKTAFFPKMTVKMAEELTGLPNAGGILSTLSSNNYFTEKRFLKETMYQYHQLFREFLLARAKETFSTERLSVLCSRAATILEEAGQVESAVSLLRDASDWDGLARLITKHAPHILAQGRHRPLEDWLSGLPIEILESNPWLFYWMGQCRLPFNPSQSKIFFEKAFEKFKDQKERAGMFLAWSELVFSIWMESKDFSLLDRWILVLEELMRDVKEFPSEEIGLQVASNMLLIMVTRQLWHPKLEKWAEMALSYAEVCPNIFDRMNALFRVAFYRIFYGELQKALVVIDLLRQLSQTPNAPPLTLIMARVMEVLYYRYVGMHEKCLQSVAKGMELSQKTGVHGFDYWLLIYALASALNVRDYKTANEFIAKIDPVANTFTEWSKSTYYLMRIRESLSRKDIGQASFYVDRASELINNVKSTMSVVFLGVARAHVMHELGKHKEAEDSLSHASSIVSKSSNNYMKFLILLAKARFAFDEQDETTGLSSLREGFALGREGGFIETYIDEPSAMSALCAKALEAGIEVEYVQDCIRKQNLIPDKPPFLLENWPWPLKIYTLGRFLILKDGQPVQFSRKVKQKPLSVLEALIAFGGKEVREDRIMDALWPEADGDMAYQSFTTNLHRLRQLLGYERAIQRQEGKLTLDDRYCWVDVWAFSNLLERADTQWKEGKIDDAIQLTEKAINIYKGPFLEKESEKTWMISFSELLQSRFLRIIEKLGQYWLKTDQYEKALDCCFKGLEVDDLAEEFYQDLMNCYHRLGRIADVRAVYQRYRKTLNTLGLEPSANIEAIYKTIKERF
jgi:ATP/maltotriose-dependent transcriptional regulator MalT/DNA-binding SARP family transcriptional activator